MLNTHLMLVVILLLIANTSLSLAQQPPPKASKTPNQYPDSEGNFYWSYSNPNGQTANQKGFVKNAGTPEAITAYTGSFSYFGKDGTLYLTQYTADERGYRPKTTVVRLPGIVQKKIKAA